MGVAFGTGLALGAAWGGSWGWGCGWGRNDVNIKINNNNNNNYVNHYNKNNINRTKYGQNGNWQHRPEHGQGVRYNNSNVRQRFGNNNIRGGVQNRIDVIAVDLTNTGTLREVRHYPRCIEAEE